MALNKKFFPKVSAAADTFTPSEHFNTVLYTGTGAAQRIGGYINRGAVFNGSAYITTGYKAVSSTAASISFWANIAAYTYYGGFVGDSTGQSSASRFFLGQGANNGTLWVSLGNGSTQWYDDTTVSLSSYGLNNWFHLVGTVDGTTVKIYINGSLIHTFTSSISYAGAGTGPYYLGGWGNALRLNGKLDQVRFFNKALSQSEVTTIYGETFASSTISTTDIFNDNSGQALYQLDGNANDSSGYSNTEQQVTINSSSSSHYFAINHTDTTGKFYFEVDYKTTQHSTLMVGLYSSGYVGGWTNSRSRSYYGSNGGKYQGGTQINYGSTFTAGDIIGVAFDATNNTIEFFKNGTSQGTAFSGNTADNSMGIQLSTGYYGETASLLLNSSDWNYSAPTGFGEWTGSITALNNGNYTTSGSSFNIVTDTYNGTATNITYQEATHFTPDLVWIKKRSSSTNSDHVLQDSVRGISGSGGAFILYSNLTNSEDSSDTNYFTSFDSNGFSLGGSTYYNGSGETYVAWCFNAGSGSETSGTGTGSITNVAYKANTGSGFSIVKYTGSGSNGTVTHGLNSAPELIIVKSRSTSGSNWSVYTSTTGNTKYLKLHSSDAAKTPSQDGYGSGTFWNETDPTSSVFSLGTINDTNKSGDNFIAYCFHSVDGYQKIGTYQGNSSTSNLVETGFRPAWILIKNPNTTDGWYILDDERKNGVFTNVLYPHLTNSELASSGGNGEYSITFLENGFELTEITAGYNQTGETYLYLAIAADPDTTTPTVEDSFDVVTYSGTGAAQDIETDFKGDLVWIKNRDRSVDHALFDSIRGATQVIRPNQTTADGAFSDSLTSFNDNGFSLGSDAQWWVNKSGDDYVAWVWKAGDHDDNLPQINTEGTIDSTVSVNDAAGFSIVKYTGTGSNATIGHGLSSAPQIIFVKRLDTSAEWVVGETVANDFTKVLRLDTSGASSTATYFNSTDPTSTVFSVRGASGATGGAGNFIAYCWYSVTGHSSIGSYSGNGSATGTVVTTGFEPRFVLIKRTDGTNSWAIHDNQRSLTNPRDKELFANLSDAEGTFTALDFLSNGFQLKTSNSLYNASGTNNYIYMAFK